jgi:tetratricopeptide (TPR) repeat protein
MAKLRWLCGLAIALAVTWLAYRPGLAGSFLFDDYANLPALGAWGKVDSWDVFLRYITSGQADIAGRPIALLSFLLDARDWPAAPAPFKLTNLFLHMCNGVLLALLLRKLSRYLDAGPLQAGEVVRPEHAWAAALAAALWMLHPLFVSTTLYVVQREAMLPATFVLLGLFGFVAGWERLQTGRRWGLTCMAANIAGFTTLAVLSKANGALLPLFALLIEQILLNRRVTLTTGQMGRYRWVRALILVAPSALIGLGLAKLTTDILWNGMPAIRPWTLGQRLLTESRIVADYLGMLWQPRPYSIGLFNDAISVSKTLFDPITTFFCCLFLFSLLGLAIVLRRRLPALSIAILFFFCGHLIESTVVPLELYFEHRNYLPALLMFWPAALWLTSNTVPLHRARLLVAVVLPLGLACLTYLGASLWGNERDQALLWAQQSPDSPRAQAYAAQVELERGQAQASVVRLQKSLQQHPDEIQVALNLIGSKCAVGQLDRSDLDKAAAALRITRNAGRLGFDWFDKGLDMARTGACPGLDLPALQRLLDAAEENVPNMTIPGRRQDLLHLRGRIALMQDDPASALREFDAAFDADPRPSAGLQQAAILASHHLPELAMQHLDHIENGRHAVQSKGISMAALHESLLGRQHYWENEIAHLRETLSADIRDRAQ